MEELKDATINAARDAAKQGVVSVVLFSAKNSAECQQMEDVLRDLAANKKEYPSAKFFLVTASENSGACKEFGVTAAPTVVFLLGANTVQKLEGANVPAFMQQFQELHKRAPTACLGDESSPLNARLKKLINSSRVMLFLKGTAEQPYCKFSKRAVEILSNYPVEYGDFDIFSDEEVREGLKLFSNWPTYPQLYVDGELIGGVDIMVQLHESGELAAALGVSGDKLNERLKTLINSAPVMIFMKGNPQQPRCGFSRTLIDIMNKSCVPYKTFDILEDEAVRQGLKTFSNWPTYPQIYVKGELIGGVDIIQQLNESGELVKTLQG